MKKKLALAMLLLAALWMFAACGNGEKQVTLSVDIASDGQSASIFATDADEGDFAMSGVLTVDKNEKITCLPAMNEGSVTIEFIRADDLGLEEDADAEDIENVGNAAVAFTMTGEGTNVTEETPKPGDYYMKVTTSKGADGVVTLTVDPVQ